MWLSQNAKVAACSHSKECDSCHAVQDMAYIVAVAYVGMSILLCGLFVRPSQLKIRPLLWLSYLSYPRQGNCLCLPLLAHFIWLKQGDMPMIPDQAYEALSQGTGSPCMSLCTSIC